MRITAASLVSPSHRPRSRHRLPTAEPHHRIKPLPSRAPLPILHHTVPPLPPPHRHPLPLALSLLATNPPSPWARSRRGRILGEGSGGATEFRCRALEDHTPDRQRHRRGGCHLVVIVAGHGCHHRRPQAATIPRPARCGCAWSTTHGGYSRREWSGGGCLGQACG